MTQEMYFEGLTLTVESIDRSIEFYSGKLGLKLEHNASPNFALIRAGGDSGGTIGLLALHLSLKEGAEVSSEKQKSAIHVELSTHNLDALYEELCANGVQFHQPPHDEPWERSMTAFDPDGYAVEFAQGRRGHNALKADGCSVVVTHACLPLRKISIKAGQAHRFSGVWGSIYPPKGWLPLHKNKLQTASSDSPRDFPSNVLRASPLWVPSSQRLASRLPVQQYPVVQ
jgi:catechol 2,3-dioxygenase-like lactoylglutathione lyase family enzyme